MAIEYTYQPFPFSGPPKFTILRLFGLKIHHLANPAEEAIKETC
jgi:hypothetical protein